MNPRVLSVEYKGNYQLLIMFTNREVRLFDLTTYLNYPVYEPLKDESFCMKVKATDGILHWNEYIDFDPDTIYLCSKPG
ncbi:MAG: DUF2442 domain-containing protein [Bacteroidota bacterium]